MKQNLHRYDKIITHQHNVSAKRKRMPRYNRSAQFSPFSALSGFEGEVQETERLTLEKIQADEDRQIMIDKKLQILLERGYEQEIILTFFKADLKKSGGAYITVCGKFKRIDEYSETIVLFGDKTIPIKDIYEIDGKVFEELFKNLYN